MEGNLPDKDAVNSSEKPPNDGNEALPEKRDKPMRAAMPILPEGHVISGPETDEILPSLPGSKEDLTGYFISNTALDRLWGRIDEVQTAVLAEINREDLADQYFKKLEEARRLIMQDRGQYEEANSLVSETAFQVYRLQRVRSSSKKVGYPLFAYEIVWMIIVFSVFILLNISSISSELMEVSIPAIDLHKIVNSMLWGAFGGVVGALYALWKHIAQEQDFDPQFSLWYITNPILGISLGGFVYLLIQAGFLSLTAGALQGETIQSAAVIYVFAWIAGFKQNVIYEIVRRILDVFRVNENRKERSGNGDNQNPGFDEA